MTVTYKKKTIEDIDVGGKRVYLRADFNVPIDDQQNITNDRRIRAALPTMQYLLDQGASLVIASHLGRPKGQAKPEFSLRPVAVRLADLLGRDVKMAPDCVGPEVEAMAAELKPGEIMLLENVRFHPEEEKNEPEFSKKMAALADCYVSDAFGSVHRAHASTEGVARVLKPAVAGYLIAKELEYLGEAMANPARPLLAILGGAKVGSKIAVIKKLMTKVDKLVIGGAMTFTFQKAMGLQIGDSKLDEESIDVAREILAEAEKAGIELVLPVDVVIADKFDNDADTQVVPAGQIPDGWMGLDAGPKTRANHSRLIREAKTVVWNGPVGVFEMPNFAEGTKNIAMTLAESDCVSILGGGDSAAAAEQFGVDHKLSHVSTGGGASLEFMEGKELPGIVALDDA